MTDVALTPITSGYNLSKINSNFTKLEEAINNDVMNLSGGNNTMLQDLDMNGFALLNVQTDIDNPDSILTLGVADSRYYNVDGDTLTGTMDVNGQTITNLKAPVAASEAARKLDVDNEASYRSSADANLQAQITGDIPLLASAFSEISWHGQLIANSVVIPSGKNAWSFGPTMTIGAGQVVTIGADSFWTIANGATTGTGTLNSEIPTPLDMGTL